MSRSQELIDAATRLGVLAERGLKDKSERTQETTNLLYDLAAVSKYLLADENAQIDEATNLLCDYVAKRLPNADWIVRIGMGKTESAVGIEDLSGEEVEFCSDDVPVIVGACEHAIGVDAGTIE